MHIFLIGLSFALAWTIRLLWRFSSPEITAAKTLSFFLVPPLTIFFTLLSVIEMGTRGEMFGFSASIFSYFIALSLLILVLYVFLRLFFQMRKALKRVREFPHQIIATIPVRVIEIDFPYSAQIGFWSPELVMTRGLINLLTPEELEAVLAHEQAHRDYRDTFWFLGLDAIRFLTFWLPNTESLWQGLLLGREIRADHQASQTVSSFVLAESLLKVAQAVSSNTYEINYSESFSVLFHPNMGRSHLIARIEFMLEENTTNYFSGLHWGIFLSLLPLFLVIWHST